MEGQTRSQMDIDLAFKISKNAHREQFLDTMRTLWTEISDYKVLSKVGLILAEKQLRREVSPIVDTL